MTSLERVMAAVSHKEPDRVPLCLLFSMYGAKELGISIKKYFANPKQVLEAQVRMKKRYHTDCYYSFFYAPIEIEAWGGEVVFVEDGPPNSGEPFLKSFEQIASLDPPLIEDCNGLQKVLETTRLLKAEAKNETPIIGVVMSPFSIPVMQMGFEKYLRLLYERRDLFDRLMRVNEAFCVAWANAQLQAGATAICYFDPLASPSMIERDLYRMTGNLVAMRTISKIQGPTATHLASAISLPVVEDIIRTQTAILGFSARDDLVAMKQAARGKICLMGNLNAVELANWDRPQVDREVKNIIDCAGEGGGLILADNHGEIPWQVPDQVLLEIAESVEVHGRYLLKQER